MKVKLEEILRAANHSPNTSCGLWFRAIYEELKLCRELMRVMHDEGLICRDHYNPARGQCEHKTPICHVIERIDKL